MIKEIRLANSVWQIDLGAPLGTAGGFGAVFSGIGDNGEVAIKKLHLSASEAAHRELDIGQHLARKELEYIVPILDQGQDASSDDYFIVMPKCEKSLQDEISAGNALDWPNSMPILRSILRGLREVPEIVHRDLKPPNILLHEGTWKVADFGIAKFVEDSTSLRTLKDCLTPAYAAPEQWNIEASTSATDIYAVGCIAHALLTGAPPFVGDNASLQRQHLSEKPKSLENVPLSVQTIISQMLRKPAAVRPDAGRCLSVFEKNQSIPDDLETKSATPAVIKAAAKVSDETAKREAETIAREKHTKTRKAIFQDSITELISIRSRLIERLKEHADGLIDEKLLPSKIRFGKANFEFKIDQSMNEYGDLPYVEHNYGLGSGDGWGAHRRASKWDFVGIGAIKLEQQDLHGRSGVRRSANIVLACPPDGEQYRWYEMSFFNWTTSHDEAPMKLSYVWEIDTALSPVMDKVQKAHDPVLIDGEDADAFLDYWLEQIGLAASGDLHRPGSLPIQR